MIKLNDLILEMSQSMIDRTYQRWKDEGGSLNPEEVKAMCNWFDSVRSNLLKKNKEGTLPLPDKFVKPDKKTNKILDINMIQNWSEAEMESLQDNYGGTRSQQKQQKKTSGGFHSTQQAQLVDVNGAPKVYGNSGIVVYEAATEQSCVKLNYVFKYKGKDDKEYSYEFCIGRVGPGNRYYKYRFGSESEEQSSFYYVADTTQPADFTDAPELRNFTNWYHFFVIRSFDSGTYAVTDAVNQYEKPSRHESPSTNWEGVGKFMAKHGGESGKQAWSKIQGLEKIFKYVEPEQQEVDKAIVGEKTLNPEQFKKLTHDQKRIYIGLKAGEGYGFDDEMFNACDPELKLLAINHLYRPAVKYVENTPALAKRYAKVIFTRNLEDFQNDKTKGADLSKRDSNNKYLPLGLIQFLSDEQKQQYYEVLGKEYLSPDLIKMFFGEEYARQNVLNSANELDYIPPSQNNYNVIPDNLKPIYKTLWQLQENWIKKFDKLKDETKLKEAKQVERAEVTPIRITYSEYIKIPKNDRDAVIDLAKKNPKSIIPYSIPSIIEGGGSNRYYVLPTKINKTSHVAVVEDWVIIDSTDKVIQKIKDIKNPKEFKIEGRGDLISYENEGYPRRFHPADTTFVNGSPFNPGSISLKEVLSKKSHRITLVDLIK